MRLRESKLLSADGRPILIAQEPGYRNAGAGRQFSQLSSTGASINTLLAGAAPLLRARSRDLLRNNPTVWKGIRTRVAEVVGTGIVPRSLWPDEGKRREIAQLWSDSVEELGAEVPADGYGQQVLAIRELFVAGECFARLRRRRPEDGLLVPLQVQLLPAEFVPHWKTETLANGNRVKAGIEHDQLGRRVAYWMHRTHPGEHFGGTDTELTRVPASEVLHLFEPLEPGQIRGEPSLARIIRQAAMRGGYLDATLQRMAIASLFAAFIKRTDSDSDPLGADERAKTLEGDVVLDPGALNYLDVGEDIVFPDTPDIGARFSEFMRAIDLDQAAGMDVTAEMATGDLSHVNFSSIRAGIVAFRRQCEQLIHTVIVPQFCRPLWREWIAQAVAARAIILPGFETAAGRRDAFRCEWTPQAWPWVDPEADVAANVAAIEARIKSRRQVIRDQGDDPDVVDAEIESDPLTVPADPAAAQPPAATPKQQRAEQRRVQRRAALHAEVVTHA